jgi:hypothetical protein
MPDTLGVTADEAAWSGGLVAGFAERQANLFDDEPSAIRTLDRAAEEANADAYRDLLHEIDRAFDGYDRSIVRHGWLGDQEPGADMARLPGHVPSGQVNLPDFVAAALGCDIIRDEVDSEVLRLPADWLAGLDDLPELDREGGTLRLTRQHDRLRDSEGRSLAYLGRVHPVVRRAIARAQRIATSASDNRNGVARAVDGLPLAVLMTFSVVLRSAVRIEFQRIIAVLLPLGGDAAEIPEPQRWLQFGYQNRAMPHEDVWRSLFADWVPRRQPEVEQIAAAAMRRETVRVTADHHQRSAREASDLQDWLRRRADEICGGFMPQTADTSPPIR